MKLTKKIFYIMIICVLLVMPMCYADSPVKFYIDNVKTKKAGEEFEIAVKAENIEALQIKPIGVKLDVFYDTALFEFVNAEEGKAASGTMELHQDYPEEGRVRCGLVAMMGMNNSGEIYKIKFKVKQNVTVEETQLKLEIKEFTDKENNEISFETSDATVALKKNSDSSQQIQEPKEPTFTAEGKLEIPKNSLNQNIKDVVRKRQENISQSNSEGNNEENNLEANIGNISEITKLNPDTMTWEVKNPDILEIKEDGTIVPKEEGETEIVLTNENGEQISIPVSVKPVEGIQMQENENAEGSTNKLYIICGIVAGIIAIGVVVTIIIKKRK